MGFVPGALFNSELQPETITANHNRPAPDPEPSIAPSRMRIPPPLPPLWRRPSVRSGCALPAH
jgi:hypothetical protein